MDKLMLSEWQFEDLIETISAIQHGHAQRTSVEIKVKFDRKNKAFTVLAELCPRYGKTIWAATVAEQLGYKVTVVASYVLTSFYSFIKEFDWYEQFRHFVLVDSKSSNYKAQVMSAVKSGKQVILFVSMCNGEKRGERRQTCRQTRESRDVSGLMRPVGRISWLYLLLEYSRTGPA